MFGTLVAVLEWFEGETYVIPHMNEPHLLRAAAEHIDCRLTEEDQEKLPALDVGSETSVQAYMDAVNELDDSIFVTLYRLEALGEVAPWVCHTTRDKALMVARAS